MKKYYRWRNGCIGAGLLGLWTLASIVWHFNGSPTKSLILDNINNSLSLLEPFEVVFSYLAVHNFVNHHNYLHGFVTFIVTAILAGFILGLFIPAIFNLLRSKICRNKIEVQPLSLCLFVAIAGFFSEFLFKNFIVTSLLLSISAILGISRCYAILRKKKKLHGLISTIAATALAIFLLIYWGYSHHHHALMTAIETGNTQKIEKLISKGYDVNADTGYGQNMLTLCFYYTPEKMRLFPSKPEPRINPSEIEERIYLMLEILIDNGANINTVDSHNKSALFIAAELGQNRIAKMLIEKGADTNLKSMLYSTPLHQASGYRGSSEMVKLLIENGADVNAKDSKGNTPLYNAIDAARVSIAKILLENGADINAKNYLGKTALMHALELSYMNAEHLASVVNLLIKNRANVNAKDTNGNSPLHCSMLLGKLEIVETLLQNGANIDAKNNDGKTALNLAVEYNRKDIIETLQKN